MRKSVFRSLIVSALIVLLVSVCAVAATAAVTHTGTCGVCGCTENYQNAVADNGAVAFRCAECGAVSSVYTQNGDALLDLNFDEPIADQLGDKITISGMTSSKLEYVDNGDGKALHIKSTKIFFDDSDDYHIFSKNKFVVSVDVKFDANSSTDFYESIVTFVYGTGTSAASYDYVLRYAKDADGVVRLTTADGTSPAEGTYILAETDTWYNCTVVVDESYCYTYVEGYYLGRRARKDHTLSQYAGNVSIRLADSKESQPYFEDFVVYEIVEGDTLLSGTCGASGNEANVTWALDLTAGTLNIAGSGKMADYSDTGAPWYGYGDFIESVSIGKNVTYIGKNAFSSLGSALVSVTVEHGNTSYKSVDNCLVDIADKTLVLGCRNSIIPDDGSVTDIGYKSFAYVSGLEAIEIPASVKYISDCAFMQCADLSSVEIKGILETVGGNAFDALPETATVTFTQKCALPDWNSSWASGCDATVVWGDALYVPKGYHYCSTADAIVKIEYYVSEGIGNFGCSDCGLKLVTYPTKGDAILDLDFDENIENQIEEPLSIRSQSNVSYVSEDDRKYIKVGGELFINDTTAHAMFAPENMIVDFEIMFEENNAETVNNESILTFICGNISTPTTTAWQYVLRYNKTADGTVEIYAGNEETKKIAVENGNWYHCAIVVDAEYYSTYIDGVLVGKMSKVDYTDEKYGGLTYLRFGNNKGSSPCFDNMTVYAVDKVITETTPRAEFESKKVKAGSEFDVTLSLKSIENLKSMLVYDLSYDTSAFELVGASWNVTGAIISDENVTGEFFSDWDDTDNIGTLAFGENTAIEGTVLTLTFKALESASGVFDLSSAIVINEKIGVNDMPVNFYIQDGEIAVIGRGDLDEDYDVDSNDAIYLLRHVLMTSRYPISQNGDMNGDGVVNTDDAIYLLRSTLYPEEYPLSSIVDHTAAADAVYTPVANGFSTVCAECGKTFVIYERDMLLNLTYEGDYSKEIAKYSAFISSTSGLNIAEDRDGDKGHLNTDGKIVYLGIADRAALAKTGYYEMSFDYTPTGDGSTTSNGGEISVLTLVPGQYGATNVGELEYYWYFKYNVHQKKFEVIKAGTDTTKLDSTNSHSVEKNVKYKIRILCDIANKANYLYVNNTYVGKCPSYIDITNDTYKENISIRIGDNGAPSPIFDNFKVRTVK